MNVTVHSVISNTLRDAHKSQIACDLALAILEKLCILHNFIFAG